MLEILGRIKLPMLLLEPLLLKLLGRIMSRMDLLEPLLLESLSSSLKRIKKGFYSFSQRSLWEEG
jgi:hypothetical protein